MEIHTAKVISCSNSRSKREVHINTYLKKQENPQINNLTLHIKESVFLRQAKSVAPGTFFMMSTWIMFLGSINKYTVLYTLTLFLHLLTRISDSMCGCPSSRFFHSSPPSLVGKSILAPDFS